MSAFAFDDSWTFSVSPQEVWELVERTDLYPRWWPQLVRFSSEGVRADARTRARVRGPLWYALDVDVRVLCADAPYRLEADVRGDLSGRAALELSEHGGGTRVRLVFHVDLRHRWLRHLAGPGRPLLRWAHNRVIDRGVRSFRDVASRRAANPLAGAE